MTKYKKQQIINAFWENFERASKFFSDLNHLDTYAIGVIDGLVMSEVIYPNEYNEMMEELSRRMQEKRAEKIAERIAKESGK